MNHTRPRPADRDIVQPHITVDITSLVRVDGISRLDLTRLVGNRVTSLVAHAPDQAHLVWQIDAFRPGRPRLSLTATGISLSDLEWALQGSAQVRTTRQGLRNPTGTGFVRELQAAPTLSQRTHTGFQAAGAVSAPAAGTGAVWPVTTGMPIEEILDALASINGVLRCHLRPVGQQEATQVGAHLLRTWTGSPNEAGAYLGKPLWSQVLVWTPGPDLSARARTVLHGAVPGLHVDEPSPASERARQWEGSDAASGRPVPAGAAAALLLPAVAGSDPVTGIVTIDQQPRPLEYHGGGRSHAPIRLGTAPSKGQRRTVSLGAQNLERHLQVVGQTGTGKSTLLAAIAAGAAAQGRAVTVLDPHGALVDRVLAETNQAWADRVRVVRLGDLDNPVPLNPWDCENPEQAERTIADLVALLAETFDPHGGGIVGPRFERWFSLVAQLSIALLGARSNLHTMTLLSRDMATLTWAAEKVKADHPDLAAAVLAEYGSLRGENTGDLVSWVLSKFQRLVGTAHQRAMFGVGDNALNFESAVTRPTITLIDLGMPVIGAVAARTAGTLILQQLWNAVLATPARHPQVFIVDEAHLFQQGALPSILAEGRKFGVGAVVAHQHRGQLAGDLQTALDANSGSLIAFRSGLEDATRLGLRLGLDRPQDLVRLPALTATASLSQGEEVTAPFTLTVDHNRRAHRADPGTVEAIVARSRTELCEPYRDRCPMTVADIDELLAPKKEDNSFLDDWLERRRTLKGVSTDKPDSEPDEAA